MASAVAIVLSLVPAACDNSKGAAVDTALLTRAAASLALSVGELVERYAAELPTGDWIKDRERLESILTAEADALDLAAVTESFSTAATASRKAGNGKVQTARQLVAAVWLASHAFRPPLPDYKPGDQDMLAAIASSLEPQLNAALMSTYNFETGGQEISRPSSLDAILANAVSHVVVIAGYNYAGQNGSHPIRDRMRTLGMRGPPAEFIDPAGNLRLPQGSEPDEQISQFAQWRSPSEGTRNALWDAARSALSRGEISKVFEPAVEKAFE
jgi:hypothetical protein